MEKCRHEFLVPHDIEESKLFWNVDSYIQVAQGLNLFDHASIREFLDWQPDKEKIIENASSFIKELKRAKKTVSRVSHKLYLSNFR